VFSSYSKSKTRLTRLRYSLNLHSNPIYISLLECPNVVFTRPISKSWKPAVGVTNRIGNVNSYYVFKLNKEIVTVHLIKKLAIYKLQKMCFPALHVSLA